MLVERKEEVLFTTLSEEGAWAKGLGETVTRYWDVVERGKGNGKKSDSSSGNSIDHPIFTLCPKGIESALRRPFVQMWKRLKFDFDGVERLADINVGHAPDGTRD